MSEAARQHPPTDAHRVNPSNAPGPLRDWLAAMRATAAEIRPEAPVVEPSRPMPVDAKGTRGPRLVAPAPHREAEPEDDGVADLMAENMMLKAKLRLEAERRDELQILLAQEIRELRSHIQEEVGKMEDLRAERDLWISRCEALAQPLFQGPAKR